MRQRLSVRGFARPVHVGLSLADLAPSGRRSSRSRRPGYIALALLVTLGIACASQPVKRRERFVDRIEVLGAKQLSLDPLLSHLAQRATPWWYWIPLLGEKYPYDAAELDRDLKRVEAYYAERGFFDAHVQPRVRRSTDSVWVDIVLEVDEGQPTRLAQVDVVGLGAIDPRLRQQILGAVRQRRGQRYDYPRYATDKSEIVRRLQRSGYAYATATGTVKVDRAALRADTKLLISPGPRVTFGTTRIVGNGPIPAEKLRNLVYWRRGETYDAERIDRTRRRLWDERLFSSVRIELPERPVAIADPKITLAVGKLRELRVGVGIGIEQLRHEARLSGQWTVRNFFGGMRRLTVDIKPAYVAIPAIWDTERSGPALDADVRLEQPDWFSSGILLYGTAGYGLDVRAAYRAHGPRGQAGVEREFFDEHLRLGVSWNMEFLDFYDVTDAAFDRTKAPLGLTLNDDPYRLAWLEQLVQIDLRDARVDPRAGALALVRLEQGLPEVGGEFRYVKVTPELRGYLPLFTKRLVLALRGMYGLLIARGHSASPITRRYFLGGPTHHRGFSFRRLAPQEPVSDEDNAPLVPIGGNAAVLFSADLRLRVTRLWGNWLALVGFVDAGDAATSSAHLELDSLHLATGASLLYQTPFGAIRAVLGVRLNRVHDTATRRNPDPGERVAFHLTFGEAF